jgi:hypothetical protein
VGPPIPRAYPYPRIGSEMLKMADRWRFDRHSGLIDGNLPSNADTHTPTYEYPILYCMSMYGHSTERKMCLIHIQCGALAAG